MMTNTLMLIPMLLVSLAGFVLTIYLVVLLIKALRKYLRSGEVRKEKSQLAKSLGAKLYGVSAEDLLRSVHPSEG